jgi:ribonuclease H2 subunit A
MLRSEPYNLNQMSHDAAIDMIRGLTDLQIAIDTCYIDTVGNPASYKWRLEKEFPGIEFIVESKADDKYAPCSAASIGTRCERKMLSATTNTYTD